MALTYGFFDAELIGNDQYDRVYSADDFAEYFSLFVANGIFGSPSNQMQVVASSTPDMNVNIMDGFGWVNGWYAKNKGLYPLAIQAASGTSNRVDAVVLRWRRASRDFEFAVVQGTPGVSPVAPAVTRTEDIYELMLATVTIPSGATNIPNSAITDRRPDDAVCGWVHGLVDQINTTELFAQYDDTFWTWFNALQEALSGDVASNLQGQINTLSETVSSNYTTLDTKIDDGLATKVNTSDKATATQANAGTLDTKWMTPLTTMGAIKNFLGMAASHEMQFKVFSSATTYTFPSTLQGTFALFVLVGGGGGGGGTGGYGSYKSGSTVYTSLGGRGGGGGSGFIRAYLVPIALLAGKTITITPGAGGSGGAGGAQNNTYTYSGTSGTDGANGGTTTVAVPSLGSLTASGGGGGGGGGGGTSSLTARGLSGRSGLSINGYTGGAGGIGGIGWSSYNTPGAGGGGGGGAGGAGGGGGYVYAGQLQPQLSNAPYGGNGGSGEISGGGGGVSEYRTTSNYQAWFEGAFGIGGSSKNNPADGHNGGSYGSNGLQGVLGGVFGTTDRPQMTNGSSVKQPFGGAGIFCQGFFMAGTSYGEGVGGGGIFTPSLKDALISGDTKSIVRLSHSGGGSILGFGAGGDGSGGAATVATQGVPGTTGQNGGVILLYGG